MRFIAEPENVHAVCRRPGVRSVQPWWVAFTSGATCLIPTTMRIPTTTWFEETWLVPGWGSILTSSLSLEITTNGPPLLKFFAGLGNRQLIAGYYDSAPARITDWLDAAAPTAGILWCHLHHLAKTSIRTGGVQPDCPEAILRRHLVEAEVAVASVHDGHFQLDLEGERGRQLPSNSLVDFATWQMRTISRPVTLPSLGFSSRAQLPRMVNSSAGSAFHRA